MTRVKAVVAPVLKEEPPLHIKYRPQHLDDVRGQDAVVRSLSKALTGGNVPHAFLFTGPAGTGKTTLARIIAKSVRCEPANIIEVDAATNTGIDDVRALTELLAYQGFGDNPNKVVIVDECHALSKAAWGALLKSVEEPPAHVYWVLCTTDDGKVPDTIKTRCVSYNLRAARRDDILDLLDFVCNREGFDTPTSVLNLIEQACNGSMRQALTMLAAVKDCETDAEVERLLEAPAENKEVIDLCRDLISGKLAWSKLTTTLRALGEPAETIRIIVINYLAACAMGAKSDKDAQRLLDLMYPFSKPFAASDKNAPLLLAFGDLLYR